MKNYYEILQVNKNADIEVINRIFKYHIKKNHPDLFQGKEKEEAQKRVQLYNEAYDILSNEEKRKKHDEELSFEEEQSKESEGSVIERLQIENEKLREEIILREQRIQDIIGELGIQYPQFVNRYYNQENYFNNSYNINNYNKNDYSDNDSNNKYANVTRRYFEYIKEFLFKIIIMIVFVILVLTVFSLLLGYNYFSIILEIFN